MPDKIKEFYGAIQTYGIFKDEAEFRSQIKSNPKEVFQVFDSIDETKGVFRDYSDFETNLDLKKKDNTASFGMGVSTAGKGSQRSVLGNYGISTKPKPKEATTGIPVSIASPQLLKQNGIKPKEQFSNLGNLNKEVIEKVKTVTANQQKDIKSMTGGPKGMLETANDAIVETLTSGVTSVASGLSGLVGGVADLMIDKTPQQSKKAPFLSNEWFKSKAPFIQEGEVADPAWYSNQGIRDKFLGWSTKLAEIAQGESEVAKTELGVTNTKESGVDAILKGNYKDAAKSILVDIGTQIPQMAAIYATGGSNVALGAMGASASGSDMTRQYAQDQDISLLDAGQSVAIGTINAVSEKIFGTDIEAGKLIGQKLSGLLGASGKALQQQIKSEGADAVKGKLIRSFGEVLRETGKGTTEESVFEEGLVSTVSFMVDALDEDKINRKGFEQLGKDLAQNVLVTGPMGGAMSFMAAQASFKPLTKEEKLKVDNYQQVIDSETASNEVKKIAQSKLEAINAGVSVKAEANYDKVMELPLEERILVMDKMNKVKSLESEYQSETDMDIRDGIIERISQLDEEINFALNPKEAEVQGTARGIDAATDTTNKIIEQSDKIQSIENRMNNAEFIDEKDINAATDELYTLLDEVDNLGVQPEVKQGIVSAIENKIKKLEGYEFETTNQVVEPGQTKAVSRGIQIIGTTTRGSKSKDAVTGERLNKKSVTAVDGTTGETMDGEFVFVDGKLDVIDRKAGTSKVFDTGRLEYTETNLDEDGVVQSITLSDPTTGDIFTINDPDVALDLSIQEKTKQLGEINDGVLEEVIQEIEVAPVIKPVVKQKQTIKNPAPSVLPNIPISSPVTNQPPANTSTKSSTPTTPEDAANLSMQMIEEETEAVSAFNKKMQKARSLFSAKKWIDRQATVRKELNRVGAKVTESFMTNVAGARAFADKRFEDVEKKVYNNLNLEDEKIFDQLAFHNRVIQIDENFDNRRLDAEIKIEELQKELDQEKARLKSMAKKPTLQEYKKSEQLTREIKQQKDNLKDKPLHPKGFTKATSELAIQGLKDKIGDEKFNDLNKRLGDYFGEFNKLLEEQYKAGLLNQETYDRFKEDKYIPRRFLSYLLIEPGTKNISPVAEKSLTKEQIKAIEGGSESLLFTDTRVLLNAAMRSSASRIAQNYANRALAKTVESLGDDNPIGKEANYSLSKGDVKTDAFGNKVTRDPDPGYTNIFYFNEKGERDAIQMKNGLAKEWLDAEKQFDDFNPVLKAVLMNGVLKALATGINPTFFISNVPVDFVNTILFTNVYDDTNIFNASRKLAAAFTRNAYNYSKLESGANVDPGFKKTYTEWVENGGMMQFLTDQGRPDEIAQRDAEIRNKKSLMPLNKFKKGVVGALAFSGEVSEKAMRLAIFEKTKMDMVKEAGGMSKISDTEYKEILAVAAASSRKTMDFAQGGLFAKKSDVFLPYLNAAIQGLRVSVEYVKSNPKKFVGKLAQASVPIAALMMYNMSVMDDPEEWADIPPHEKENYFIILKPWKNEEGKREYYRIKKHPSIQWFTNAVESSVIGTHDSSVEDKDKINKGKSFVSSEWETINNALPIPLDFRKSLSKAPATVQAAIAYVANFDLFRNEKISQDFGEVTPVLEGRYDKNVPLFYKEFGKISGASPKRTQAAVEKVVTNPGTNAVVGLSYSLLDNMVTGLTGKPKTGTESKYQDASPKGIADIFKARVVREINPKYSEFKDTRAKDLELELKSQDKEIKSDIKAIFKTKKTDEDASKEAVEHLKKLILPVEEKIRFTDFIKDQVKLRTAISEVSVSDAEFYVDLKHEQDPRLRAFLFFDKFGVIDDKAQVEVKANAKKFGYKLFGNERFDAEYNKLVNEQMALSKSKQK